MQAQRQQVGLELRAVEILDRVGDATVEELTTRKEEGPVRDVADAVVREVEVLADAVEDPPAHELLDSPRGVAFVETAGTMQQRELERPSDDGGHVGQLTAALRETRETTGHDFPHAVGNTERPGRGRGPFRGSEHGLHDHERVALADRPGMIREPGQHHVVAFRPRERSRQLVRLRPREGRQRHSHHGAIPFQLVECGANCGRLVDLLDARGHDQEKRPLTQTTAIRGRLGVSSRIFVIGARPRINLILYRGVLAPHARWRGRVAAYDTRITAGSESEERAPEAVATHAALAPPPRYYEWAKLMRRAALRRPPALAGPHRGAAGDSRDSGEPHDLRRRRRSRATRDREGG